MTLKILCHFYIIFKVLFLKWFVLYFYPFRRWDIIVCPNSHRMTWEDEFQTYVQEALVFFWEVLLLLLLMLT
jgi:hypothetical protein